MKYYSNKTKSGVSLIETVVYVALFATIFGFVLGGIVSLHGVVANVRNSRLVNQSAFVALGRISREIASASFVNVLESTLDSSPGVLSLTFPDMTVKTFSINPDGILVMNSPEEFLTPDRVEITELTFSHIVTPVSEVVRVELELENKSGKRIFREKYYNLVVLKGSY